MRLEHLQLKLAVARAEFGADVTARISDDGTAEIILFYDGPGAKGWRGKLRGWLDIETGEVHIATGSTEVRP